MEPLRIAHELSAEFLNARRHLRLLDQEPRGRANLPRIHGYQGRHTKMMRTSTARPRALSLVAPKEIPHKLPREWMVLDLLDRQSGSTAKGRGDPCRVPTLSVCASEVDEEPSLTLRLHRPGEPGLHREIPYAAMVPRVRIELTTPVFQMPPDRTARSGSVGPGFGAELSGGRSIRPCPLRSASAVVRTVVG